ncbi:MAG: DegV family protein [Chloroflexi bacterium]|nr:DegV family protein [Chloroflexota bacterium]
MQIVTDRAADLSQEQIKGLPIHYAPLFIVLEDKTYSSGIDIQPENFYELLEGTDAMPTTSLPSAGEFAELYREVAKKGSEILSIHISSGLSGTFEAARMGAEMVKEASITLIDSMSLSGAEGWLVEFAGKLHNAGWPKDKIVETLEGLREHIDLMFTLPSLRYLIHGGRISHLSGLLASALNIKPVIGVSKEDGRYEQRARVRSFNGAIKKLAELALERHPKGTPLRIQIAHGRNPDAAAQLKQHLEELFECHFLPTMAIAPVLGAHTGPGIVGMIYAPMSAFADLPAD